MKRNLQTEGHSKYYAVRHKPRDPENKMPLDKALKLGKLNIYKPRNVGI